MVARPVQAWMVSHAPLPGQAWSTDHRAAGEGAVWQAEVERVAVESMVPSAHVMVEWQLPRTEVVAVVAVLDVTTVPQLAGKGPWLEPEEVEWSSSVGLHLLFRHSPHRHSRRPTHQDRGPIP